MMTRVSDRHETSTHQRTHSIICYRYLLLWMKLHSSVETPADFLVPFLSMLISIMFIPKQAVKPTLGGGGGREASDTRIFGAT